MNLKIKVKSKLELTYYVALFFALVYKFVLLISVLTPRDAGPRMLIPSICLLLIISFGMQRITFANTALTLLGFVSYYVSKDTSLLLFMLLIVASKNIDMDRIVKFWFAVQSLFILPCIAIYLPLYAIGSPLANTMVTGGSDRIKCTFFFAHPNNFSVQLAFCVLAYVYINYYKFSKKKIYFILILAIAFICVFPKTYAASSALLALLLLIMLQGHWKYVWKGFVRYGLPLVFAVAVYITWMKYKGASNAFIDLITGTFESRFSGAAYAMRVYPLNLFGHTMEDIGNRILVGNEWIDLWYDLAYLRVFSAFGLVGGISFLAILFRTIWREIKERNDRDLLFISVVCIYALAEWTAFSITTAFPLLFTRIALQKRNSMKNRV